ncbi:MAG: HAD-IIB family hydrolase, partial [Acidimicrobiia bacterium]
MSSYTGRQGAVTGLDRIRAVIVDVDGTLVDSEKRLTKRTIEVVHELQAHDIEVMLTSGRPPRGMLMLVDPLNLTMPLAAFNGGMFVDPDMTTLDRHLLVDELIDPLCAMLSDSGL